jgi:hypothetical protein
MPKSKIPTKSQLENPNDCVTLGGETPARSSLATHRRTLCGGRDQSSIGIGFWGFVGIWLLGFGIWPLLLRSGEKTLLKEQSSMVL